MKIKVRSADHIAGASSTATANFESLFAIRFFRSNTEPRKARAVS